MTMQRLVGCHCEESSRSGGVALSEGDHAAICIVLVLSRNVIESSYTPTSAGLRSRLATSAGLRSEASSLGAALLTSSVWRVSCLRNPQADIANKRPVGEPDPRCPDPPGTMHWRRVVLARLCFESSGRGEMWNLRRCSCIESVIKSSHTGPDHQLFTRWWRAQDAAWAAAPQHTPICEF